MISLLTGYTGDYKSPGPIHPTFFPSNSLDKALNVNLNVYTYVLRFRTEFYLQHLYSAAKIQVGRAKREVGQVIRVIDGDTIEVNIDDSNYTVRYIYLDTPEVDEYFGGQAAQKNHSMVMWKHVILVIDVSETDRYNRRFFR
jgi:endonuclease YncB( thermonuclease family)